MPAREVMVIRPGKGDTTILFTKHGDGLNLLLGEFGPEQALDACPAEMLPALARKVFRARDVGSPSPATARMTALLRRRVELENAPYCVFRGRDRLYMAYAGAHAGAHAGESYSERAQCAVANCVINGMDSGGAIPSITGFGTVKPEDIVTVLHERRDWKINQSMEHVASLSLLAPSSFPPWEWGFSLPVKIMAGDRKAYLVGPRESVEAGAEVFGGPNVMPRPAPLPPLYDFSEGPGYARLEYGPWKFEASDVLGLGRKFLHGLFPDFFHPQNLKRERAKRRAGEYRSAGCDAPVLGVPHDVLRRWLPLVGEAPFVGILYDAEVDLQGAEWSVGLEDGNMQVYGAGDHRFMRVNGEVATHLLSMCSVANGYDPLLGFNPVIRPELLPASWRGDIAARMPEWFSKQANYLRSLLTWTLRITDYGGKHKYMPLRGDESLWRAAVLRRYGSRWEMMGAAEAVQWARSGILSEAEEMVVCATSDIFMKEAIGKLTGRMELPWW